jgi:hypothetical protein
VYLGGGRGSGRPGHNRKRKLPMAGDGAGTGAVTSAVKAGAGASAGAGGMGAGVLASGTGVNELSPTPEPPSPYVPTNKPGEHWGTAHRETGSVIGDVVVSEHQDGVVHVPASVSAIASDEDPDIYVDIDAEVDNVQSVSVQSAPPPPSSAQKRTPRLRLIVGPPPAGHTPGNAEDSDAVMPTAGPSGSSQGRVRTRAPTPFATGSSSVADSGYLPSPVPSSKPTLRSTTRLTLNSKSKVMPKAKTPRTRQFIGMPRPEWNLSKKQLRACGSPVPKELPGRTLVIGNADLLRDPAIRAVRKRLKQLKDEDGPITIERPSPTPSALSPPPGSRSLVAASVPAHTPAPAPRRVHVPVHVRIQRAPSVASTGSSESLTPVPDDFQYPWYVEAKTDDGPHEEHEKNQDKNPPNMEKEKENVENGSGSWPNETQWVYPPALLHMLCMKALNANA